MKQRLNLLKISTISELLDTNINLEVDIPVFEEAFDIKELKKFYRDRDSTSTFSPKSSISLGKYTPTDEKESQLEQVPLNYWFKNASFKIKIQELTDSNENKNQIQGDLTKNTPIISSNTDKYSNIQDNSIQSEKVSQKSRKLIRKPPFILIRNSNKKLKISDDCENDLKLSYLLREEEINIKKVNILNKTAHKQCYNEMKKKRIWFTIERNPME